MFARGFEDLVGEWIVAYGARERHGADQHR